MTFIVAYDICLPSRLKEVARCLERHAVRVQKSVFIFEGTVQAMDDVLKELLGLIDLGEDRVQIWPVASATSLHRWEAGKALPTRMLAAIVGQRDLMILGDTL